MGILAKRKFFLRFVGAFIILLGIVLSIIFDYFLLNILTFLFSVFPILILFSFIACLKIEVKYVREHYFIISVIVSISLIMIIITGCLFGVIESISLLYLLITSSNILISISWHYSLTIYRNKKILAIAGYSLSSILTIFIRSSYSNNLFDLVLSLIPLMMIICGLLIIIITELRMRKKGFLNYL
jgi:hypothetical protein